MSDTEGNSGTKAFTFTVTLSTASSQTITVNYATASGSATAGSDYAAIPTTTLTFAPGETSKPVAVTVTGDTLQELDEDFFINLTAPVNATIAKAQGIGTINNDDAPPTVTVNNASVAEGNVGTTDMVFTVTLSAASALPLTFSDKTIDGTATAGSDYVAANSTLTFAPGETSKQIIIQIIGDVLAEGNETFQVEVTGPVAPQESAPRATINEAADQPLARIAQTVRGTGTIIDDDSGLDAPGTPFSPTSELSDQKAGSVLIFPVYSSSLTNPGAENTRLNLTNTNPREVAYVHLFFVDGSTCAVADSYICLTPNQTTTLNAADIDPGVTGYVVAVAVNKDSGCPISFNFLIGDEYVKFQSGHAANLGAEAFAALFNTAPTCAANTAELAFDGVSYNRAPRVLAVDSIPSQLDGNATMLIVNRVGGDLSTNAGSVGSLFGLLYDELENPYSFQFSGGCQYRNVFSAQFPRTTPRINTVIPAGRTGWMKLSATADLGILGVVINRNVSSSPTAFNQGHNLHKLTLTSTAKITIPVFPPNCR